MDAPRGPALCGYLLLVLISPRAPSATSDQPAGVTHLPSMRLEITCISVRALQTSSLPVSPVECGTCKDNNDVLNHCLPAICNTAGVREIYPSKYGYWFDLEYLRQADSEPKQVKDSMKESGAGAGKRERKGQLPFTMLSVVWDTLWETR